MPEEPVPRPESTSRASGREVSRRWALRIGAVGAAAVAVGAGRSMVMPSLARRGLATPDGIFDATSIAVAAAVYTEVFPTSPLILAPFNDPLPILKALAPLTTAEIAALPNPPGPGVGQQNSLGNETHQKWTSDIGFPDPLVYHIKMEVNTHSFTSSPVLAIDDEGNPTTSFDASGNSYAPNTIRTLPDSTIYGMNGAFPSPLINAEYGKAALVRFSNHLDENPKNLDRQDFGAPDLSFLIHLHNAHTASESDGNPHYSMVAGPHDIGYGPGQFVDNLYLNWAAGSDDREKQTFFWLHDHTMGHTGDNVYKGIVGMYPLYDPKDNLDDGDETTGLRLPGVRTDNPDGSFNVEYDIPLAIYDCLLDDGVTMHNDFHDPQYPAAGNPRNHPDWWGKTFYRHFPNHGFVGDIFTVNGKAFPVLEVKRRKYRLRFLNSSVSRIYEFAMMSSTQGPRSSVSLGYTGEQLQGQYRIEDGQECMRLTQIATDGGLLPAPLTRDSFELWPSKRREFVVDFTQYLDGTPTHKGDVVYLTNIMMMPNGRIWKNSTRSFPDPAYKIPMMKIVIGDDAEDVSQVPAHLRDLPPLPRRWDRMVGDRLIFEVQRGSAGGEIEWLINGKQFDPQNPLVSLKNPEGHRYPATPRMGSFNLWEIRNGGGGWVHPMHLHMEEHRVVMRNSRSVVDGGDPAHPDQVSREDVIALDPDESVVVYRGFRDFLGPYVVHCHNLMHEDHAMMFAWTIVP